MEKLGVDNWLGLKGLIYLRYYSLISITCTDPIQLIADQNLHEWRDHVCFF